MALRVAGRDHEGEWVDRLEELVGDVGGAVMAALHDVGAQTRPGLRHARRQRVAATETAVMPQ